MPSAMGGWETKPLHSGSRHTRPLGKIRTQGDYGRGVEIRMLTTRERPLNETDCGALILFVYGGWGRKRMRSGTCVGSAQATGGR